MNWRWLLDRQDPRTILLVTVFILGFGIVIARSLIDSGLPTALVAMWLLVCVAQIVWAARNYRRWRSGAR